jgi:hypothetical protein
MEDMTSSKLALRSLLKESKEKRASSSLTQDRAVIPNPMLTHDISLGSEEKRKEQLRIGKIIFDFFEQKQPEVEEDTPVRKKGRPAKESSLKAKNITICLSKDHIDLLDKLNPKERKAKGRGRKVRFLIDSYIKYQNREKEQVRAIQEALRVVSSHIDTFSRNFKRAEKFTENEKSLTDMEKAISNLRIVQSLLKIESSDLKKYLNEKELSTFEFALNWLSNKAGDQ